MYIIAILTIFFVVNYILYINYKLKKINHKQFHEIDIVRFRISELESLVKNLEDVLDPLFDKTKEKIISLESSYCGIIKRLDKIDSKNSDKIDVLPEIVKEKKKRKKQN